MTRLLSLFAALFFLLPVAVKASGQMIAEPGETVEVTAETTLTSPTYTWTIMQGESVIEKLSGATFRYMFNEAGNYIVTLTAEDAAGKSETSTVDILVGKRTNQLLSLKAVLQTLPVTDTTGTVFLNPNKLQVVFYAGESEGDIVEYRIDRDIAIDSDGDGNPANDIDNASDASLQKGAPWGITFSELAASATSRLTVVGSDGSEKSTDVVFRTKPAAAPDTKLTANIAALPAINSDGEMQLAGDAAEAVLYFGDSTGNIVQYRFDNNIAIDSDGDGDPANDIDNKNHPSFLSGEPLQVTLRKSDGENQIFQLIVVSADGKGSRIRRKVVFQDPESAGATATPGGGILLEPKLLLNQSQAKVGETLSFSIFGAPQGARFSWDFDNDGTIDASSEKANAQYAYQSEGEYSPTVTVVYGNQTKVITESISVVIGSGDSSATMAPTADFSFVVEGSTVRFTNLSAADPRLEENALQFAWNFGDGATSTDSEPEHQYTEIGNFTTTLEVTDNAGMVAKKSVDIAITELGTTSTETPQASGESQTPAPSESSPTQTDDTQNGSFIVTLLKWVLFLFLLLFLLLGGYFVYRKIHDPDQSFQEILDEERARFFKPRSPLLPLEERSSPFSVTAEPQREAQREEQSKANTRIDIEDATIVQKPKSSPAENGQLSVPPQNNSHQEDIPPPSQQSAPENEPSVFADVKTEETPKPKSSEPLPPSAEMTVESEDDTRSNIKEEMPDWLRESSKPSTPTVTEESSSAAPQVSPHQQDVPPPSQQTAPENEHSVFADVKTEETPIVPKTFAPSVPLPPPAQLATPPQTFVQTAPPPPFVPVPPTNVPPASSQQQSMPSQNRPQFQNPQPQNSPSNIPPPPAPQSPLQTQQDIAGEIDLPIQREKPDEQKPQ